MPSISTQITMSVKVTLTKNRFPSLSRKLQQRVAPIVEETKDKVVDATKRNVLLKQVYDTGALFQSVRKIASGVEIGVPYAVFHEYGLAGYPARPMLTPALEQERPLMLLKIKLSLEELARNG